MRNTYEVWKSVGLLYDPVQRRNEGFVEVRCTYDMARNISIKGKNNERMMSAKERVEQLIKGQHQCKLFRKSFFFCLKFSLNLIEYEAKGFIHKKKNFCLISRFSWGVSGVSHTQHKTSNAFFSKHVFSKRHAPLLEQFSIFSFQILTTYFKQHFEEKHVRIFR